MWLGGCCAGALRIVESRPIRKAKAPATASITRLRFNIWRLMLEITSHTKISYRPRERCCQPANGEELRTNDVDCYS
jgi:hypothetical protein